MVHASLLLRPPRSLLMTYVRMEDVPRVGNIVIPGNHKEF